MQPYNRNNEPLSDPVPFAAEKIEEYLANSEVDHVKVFKLKEGMRLNIGGVIYKVTTVRPNGKAVIKPVGPVKGSTNDQPK